jgi:hypothetical protein
MSRVTLVSPPAIEAILAGLQRWVETDYLGDHTITDGRAFLRARVVQVDRLGAHANVTIGSLDPFVVRATASGAPLLSAVDDDEKSPA